MSLLLGAAALLAGLTQFFGPQHSGDPKAPIIKWNAQTAKSLAGNATFTNNELQIELAPIGGAAVSLQMDAVAAKAYPYLHLEIANPSRELSLAINWKSGESYYWLTPEPGTQSLWIATEELKDWHGEISELGIFLVGKPGEIVRIRDFSIYPAAPWYQLASIYSDLTAFIPWNRAAMNTYTGVSGLSSFYPIALAVPLLAFSLAAYGLLLLAFRARLRFDWTVVALLFLACWVVLDLVWQNRLLKQLADTHWNFAGKNTAEKRAAGPDASLVKFVSQIEPLLDANSARVFVASTDQYSGMRTAYYLYPHNVFWSVHIRELPFNTFLRAGDYVALVNPTEFKFIDDMGLLVEYGRAPLKAQQLYSDATGSLLRLN